MTAGVDLDTAPALAGLRAAVDSLRELTGSLAPDRVWTCSAGEVTEMLRAHAELAAVVEAAGLALVREADVRCLASDAGQTSTGAWLATLLRLHPGEASARVKTADVLTRKAPDTAAALAAGAVNPEQVRAITRSLTRIEAHASAAEYAEAEARLLGDARTCHAGDLTRLGRHIEAVLDPDGSDPEDRARAQRNLTITNLGNGRHRVRGTLTDEGAAVVNAAIDVLAAPRPALDGERDPRSAGQRRADALVDLGAAYLRSGEAPTSRGVRPHVHVTVSWETLLGNSGHPYARTATGEDLDVETVRKLCCDAGITGIVVNTLGEPLAVGRESRTVTPAIWAALLARDVGCVFAGCTRPASWCQAHHIAWWWRDDGETSLENMALLCDFHHDQIHHHGWQIRLGSDGHPEMIPPPGLDPLQQPQRNAHWKLAREGLHTEPDRGP